MRSFESEKDPNCSIFAHGIHFCDCKDNSYIFKIIIASSIGWSLHQIFPSIPVWFPLFPSFISKKVPENSDTSILWIYMMYLHLASHNVTSDPKSPSFVTVTRTNLLCSFQIYVSPRSESFSSISSFIVSKSNRKWIHSKIFDFWYQRDTQVTITLIHVNFHRRYHCTVYRLRLLQK